MTPDHLAPCPILPAVVASPLAILQNDGLAINLTTDPPLRIALIACVTRQDDAARDSFSYWVRFKQTLRWQWNLLVWYVSGSFRFRYWDRAGRGRKNVGDSAIREATRDQFTRLFAPRGVIISEHSWAEADGVLARRLNDESDLVVWSAGAVAHIAPSGRLNATFAQYAAFVRALSVPCIAYGIGLSSRISSASRSAVSLDSDARDLLQSFTHSLALCSTRDDESQRQLQMIAGPQRRIHLVSDPALFLPSAIGDPCEIEGVPIGINLAFHGPHCESLARQYFAALLECVRAILVAVPGCRFFYFLHSGSEYTLYRLLRMAGLPLELVEGPPEYLLTRYRHMRIHIGEMLHSCILAVNAGVPVLGLAYDSKHLPFLSSVGLAEYCLAPGEWTVGRIVPLVVDMIRRREALVATLTSRKAALRDSQSAFLARVQNLVIQESATRNPE